MVPPEDVVRVVATLDLAQAIPGRARVCRADPFRSFLAEEVHVRAGIVLLQGLGKVLDPRFTDVLICVTVVERGGWFTVDERRCSPDEVPEDVKPIREERRE